MSNEQNNNNMPMVVLGTLAILGLAGIAYTSSMSYDDECDDLEMWRHNNDMITSESYCSPGYSSSAAVPTPQPVQAEAYVPPPFNSTQENYNNTGNTDDYPPMKHYASGTGDIPFYDSKSGNTAPFKSVSPLGFGQMAGGYDNTRENYNFENNSGLSDFVTEADYGLGGQNIPVYNPADGQVGLPVPDMTDISAGENNKYVYDRTIGTIGFTSTKIGGRRRGQADYVRGDLPIIPDQNTHFQVSADPANTLMVGFFNTQGGMGTDTSNPPPKSKSSSGGQRAIHAEFQYDPMNPGPYCGQETLDITQATFDDIQKCGTYWTSLENAQQATATSGPAGAGRAAAPLSVRLKAAEKKERERIQMTKYAPLKTRDPSFQGGTQNNPLTKKPFTVADIQKISMNSDLKARLSGYSVNQR